MENTGVLLILGLLVVGSLALWAINRAGTRAGLPTDVPSRPRPVDGRPVNPRHPTLGGDTFTAAENVLTGRDEPGPSGAGGPERQPQETDGGSGRTRGHPEPEGEPAKGRLP